MRSAHEASGLASGRPVRGWIIAILVLGVAAALASGGRAAADPGLQVLYGPAASARAINDGATGVAGLPGTVRQGPVNDDPRWPAPSLLAKVSGAELARLQPAAMARALRSAWSDPRTGGLVGVDEIAAADWGPAQSAALADALSRLGPDARRVVLYASPGIVSQIGRVDPRLPLGTRLTALLGAMRGAGAVELEMYHGDLSPFSAYEFAVYTTRVLARWAPGDPAQLHLMFGPSQGIGQAKVWNRARATPAGREILANGAGAYGLPSAAEGLDWLAADQAFLSDPAGPPPGGDYAVPVGGGLTVSSPKERTTMIVLSRPSRAVLRVIPAGGGTGRVVAKVVGPTGPAGVAVQLPPDLAPGRYRLITVALGQDLRDTDNVGFTVDHDWASRGLARSLALEYRGGSLRLSVGSGYRAVVRLVPPRGAQRVIAKVHGAVRQIPIALPADLVPGAYRALVVAVGPNGRQGAGTRFRVAGKP